MLSLPETHFFFPAVQYADIIVKELRLLLSTVFELPQADVGPQQEHKEREDAAKQHCYTISSILMYVCAIVARA